MAARVVDQAAERGLSGPIAMTVEFSVSTSVVTLG
jgi:hypothetical protein